MTPGAYVMRNHLVPRSPGVLVAYHDFCLDNEPVPDWAKELTAKIRNLPERNHS